MLTKNDFINTVTLIDAYNGEERHTGTGFFYKYFSNNTDNYVIVTNKHILENCDTFEFFISCINAENNNAEMFNYNIKTTPYCHKVYDVAAIGINDIIKPFDNEKYSIYIKYIGEEDILNLHNDNWISSVENVLMVGYPHAIVGDGEHCPIIKQGITATPLKKKYDKKEQFLTDILSFEGSSGSPLYIENESRYWLAGIHYASLQKENIHTGLGVNINTNVLLDFLKF